MICGVSGNENLIKKKTILSITFHYHLKPHFSNQPHFLIIWYWNELCEENEVFVSMNIKLVKRYSYQNKLTFHYHLHHLVLIVKQAVKAQR